MLVTVNNRVYAPFCFTTLLLSFLITILRTFHLLPLRVSTLPKFHYFCVLSGSFYITLFCFYKKERKKFNLSQVISFIPSRMPSGTRLNINDVYERRLWLADRIISGRGRRILPHDNVIITRDNFLLMR